ncbi:MAG: phosphodiester glycosidase family protein, partial [Verrucomicrobiota bacterium]
NLYPGIDHAVGWSDGTGGDPLLVLDCLRIDLTNPNIEFAATPQNGSLDTVTEKTGDFLVDHDLDVAINAQSWSPWNSTNWNQQYDANPSGSLVTHGAISSDRDTYSHDWRFDRDNNVSLQIQGEGVPALGLDVWAAISGYNHILDDGVVTYASSGSGSQYELHPRTATGLSADGNTFYMMTVDGRQPGVSVGVNLHDLALWIQTFGAYNALNHDGGGSSTMVKSDAAGGYNLLNVPVGSVSTPGTERCVGANFGVRSKSAGTRTWDGATGNWATGSNWDTDTIPYKVDDIVIANGGTALVTQAGSCDNFTLGTAAGGGTVEMSDGTLTLENDAYVGNEGAGSLVVSGGALRTQSLGIGYNAGGTGNVSVVGSGATIDINNGLTVGHSGNGTLTINDGEVEVSGGANVLVGNAAGSSGTINMAGGTFTAPVGIKVANHATATGVFNLSGGTFTASSYLYLGLYGTASAVQTGGTAYFLGGAGLVIGGYGGSSGSYTISNGNFQAATTYTGGAYGLALGSWGGSGTFKVIGDDAVVYAENYNQSSTGTLISEIDADGISLINVYGTGSNGKANIDGTFTVLDSGAAIGTHTILTAAASGISGSFDTVNLPNAYWSHEIGATTLSVTHHSPAGDADADGLPNWWEVQYYGGLTTANTNDICSNGVNTVEDAYVAGFDPTNSLAGFLISDLTGNILQWDEATGRVYTVYWTTNLLDGFSVVLTNNYSGGVFTDTVHGAEAEGFYQLEVEVAP